ncbi:glyoxalase/bleomycin resistance/extradiol dioxygenase family protein [Staphylococcus aureus]|nr:glyoxalase/bleomycin resistance/extradiol dioxygenase family protein [Staphylococcus aureus]
MTALFPYIAFENSKEALAYYEEVFGATDVKRLEVGEEQASHFGMTKEEAQEATMHAEFEVLGVKVLCSDSFGRADKINNGISLLIDYDVNNKEDADKVEAFYEQIKDHSSIEIELPFADQFWGGKMGAFTDKYGVRWMLHGQDYTAIQQ